jgi:hypothetical protein
MPLSVCSNGCAGFFSIAWRGGGKRGGHEGDGVPPAPRGRHATLKVRGVVEAVRRSTEDRSPGSAEPGRVSVLASGDRTAVHSLDPACPAASSTPL